MNWPKGFSPLAKDLILKLLKVNPEERISIQELLNHKWTKSHSPIRETITNDLTNKEKLPETEQGEVQMKENEYVVVSTPQSKLQYQNLKIQEATSGNILGQMEETKQNLQISEQQNTQEQAASSQIINQQQSQNETEIQQFKQLNKELEDKIQVTTSQNTQKGRSYHQKLKEYLNQKQQDIQEIKQGIENTKIKTKETESSFQINDIEAQNDKDQYSILNSFYFLIHNNIYHQVNIIKSEIELLRSHISDISQTPQTKLDNQQIMLCKESLNKMNSQITFDSNLQKNITVQNVQLQKLAKDTQQVGAKLNEGGTVGLKNNQSFNVEDQKILHQKLQESLEQQAQYKQQLQIINSFWDIDKKKIEDMKQEISTYENLVKNFKQNLK